MYSLASGDGAVDARWHLYRLLSDPVRLRLLALVAQEELAMGELADLLGEAQPNVSRHTAPLRQAGLIKVRRQGTRTLAHLAEEAQADTVVADALATGTALCHEDGSLARVEDVVRARDARTREFFARTGQRSDAPGVAAELPAYLFALKSLGARRRLAVDAGTGDGGLLDALAPLFDRVIALDRSEAQLELARARVRSRGFDNVELVRGEVDDSEVREAIGDGADAVVAARMLHHAPRPRATVAALTRLLCPTGTLVVIDYAAYDDESFRERQADVWMGFELEELRTLAKAGGLEDIAISSVPAGCTGTGPDRHMTWQTMVARKPTNGGSRDPA